ncbi:MAG: hypothetical protein SFT93_04755 [Rickettsiaceae bacterium]|nr:hypothetical protein [Rickettsiaceae bacterium]
MTCFYCLIPTIWYYLTFIGVTKKGDGNDNDDVIPSKEGIQVI